MNNKTLNDNNKFASGKIPSMKRRNETHDYKSERFYLITLVVDGRTPILGWIVGDVDAPKGSVKGPNILLSPLGVAVVNEWKGITSYYPQVAVISWQVMPDHFHGILYVREHTDFHIGQVIKGFKLGCNKLMRDMVVALKTQHTRKTRTQNAQFGDFLSGHPCGVSKSDDSRGARYLDLDLGLSDSQYSFFISNLLSYAAIPSQPTQPRRIKPLWERGYNDKILYNYSTLQRWKEYLYDNPRRLAVRRANPEYFRVRFGIEIAGQTYAAIGNRFLLNHPEKQQVQLSRSLSDAQIQTQVEHFMTLARRGVILVSPAISKGEQTVMRAVMDAHLPLIFLTPWGFHTFSKPGHQYYSACAEGRFLMLAPWEHHNERIPLTRLMCLELNEMVSQICKL